MHLNTISSCGRCKKPTRVGRGWSSGKGKTAGRGTKGQHARTSVKQGFEGGQMPFHRRVPKSGFTSWRTKHRVEVGTGALAKIEGDVLDIEALKTAKLIRTNAKFIKIIASGEVQKAITVKGIKVTKGARKLLEAAGGRVEE